MQQLFKRLTGRPLGDLLGMTVASSPASDGHPYVHTVESCTKSTFSRMVSQEGSYTSPLSNKSPYIGSSCG